MQSDVNFPLVLCKPTSQIIQPKFNQCKRFVLHPHFSFIYLTISILGSSTIFRLSLIYTLRFVPSKTLAKLRRLYYNLTGSEAVFDDYCFFNFWCNRCTWIQSFWLCKKAIDKMLKEGKKPKYKLCSFTTGEELPYETVNGYYVF